MELIQEYYSHGKLMLTGEYLVLDGAKSFALATKFGQHLSIEATDNGLISWTSVDHNNDVWFDAEFRLSNFEIIQSTDENRAIFLASLFAQIEKLNNGFLSSMDGIFITARLEFDPDWGLGSSSTLINNLAMWASISPFELLDNTLGGSGYDIAVANTSSHVLFQRLPEVDYKSVEFDPPFKKNIFFVYLNKKQNSAKEVSKFNAFAKNHKNETQQISTLTENIQSVKLLSEFEKLLTEHNLIMSKVLGQKSAQEKFPKYTGGILKYLGAWGGDFMLATGDISDMIFFKENGYHTVLTFDQMIKK